MLTLIENEVVNKRKWLSHAELMDIFAVAESTPGAIAINIATYIGTKQVGILGGIFTTLGVVLPSFLIIIGLSYVIALVKDNFWVNCLFKGIRIGVLVLIAKAVVSFYKDIKKNLFSFFLIICAFLIAFLTKISVIYIILGSAVISSFAVALINYRNRKIYHMFGTNHYFSEYLHPDNNADDQVYRRLKSQIHSEKIDSSNDNNKTYIINKSTSPTALHKQNCFSKQDNSAKEDNLLEKDNFAKEGGSVKEDKL